MINICRRNNCRLGRLEFSAPDQKNVQFSTLFIVNDEHEMEEGFERWSDSCECGREKWF